MGVVYNYKNNGIVLSEEKKMDYLPLFKMPSKLKITSRSSSITNAFVNSIIPTIQPSENQVRDALLILEMTPETFQCSYCGDVATEWDHLRALVSNRKPTGYISEINNLVPACGKCNQSKGNKNWKTWMLSDAKLSPKTKNVPDINERIERLEKYESWGSATIIDFESMVDEGSWQQHWSNCEKIINLMRESQELAEKINHVVEQTR